MEMLTQSEKQRVEARLAALKANRPVISLRIAEARALGDLKENGDYHAAREQQGIEEAEIRRLEDRLARAHVVDKGIGLRVELGHGVARSRATDVDAVEEAVGELM